MSTVELIFRWGPTALSFAVVSGGITALMQAYKKMVRSTAFADTGWYERTLPILPSLIGMAAAPGIGPYVTPAELPILVHIFAGALQGSLGVHMYHMWKNAIARTDEKVQETITNLGTSERTPYGEPEPHDPDRMGLSD